MRGVVPLRRAIRLGWAGVGVLAVGVAGLGVADWRHHRAGGAVRVAAGDAVEVTVTGSACQPSALEVPAGRVVFRILNRSDRVLEWEILDGVMVVEERENIAPGLSQRLTAQLAPGAYAITCGLLSNPRGRLVVVPSGVVAAVGAPELRALIGPMAEYQVYLTLEGMALSEAGTRLAAASEPGERAAALVEAVRLYQHIRPVAKLLRADLDGVLEARPEDFAGGAGDPGFGGFRRLAVASPAEAMGLVAGIRSALGQLLPALENAMVPPDRMLAGAALLAGEAAHEVSPERQVAMLEGAGKVLALLGPPLKASAPEAVRQAKARQSEAMAALEAGQVQAARQAAQGLSESLTSLREALGAS